MSVEKHLKIPFPESSWILHVQRRDNRLELALYWRDKPVPTHIAAVLLETMRELIE